MHSLTSAVTVLMLPATGGVNVTGWGASNNSNHKHKDMKTQVIGTYRGHDAYGVMEWECPTTGRLMSMDGQFAFDEEGYWHDVLSEDDEYLYTVVADVRREEEKATKHKFPRMCSISGEGMWEGYCFGEGEEYAKTKEFAEIIAKRNGYDSLWDSYQTGDHYWTEWEDLDEDGWYESDYQDGRDAVWVDADGGLPSVTIGFGSVVYEFTPSEADEWQSDGKYDYHYSLEDNEVCVYKVIDGDTDTSTTIHKQKIKH